MTPLPIARLTDIIEAIELIRNELAGRDASEQWQDCRRLNTGFVSTTRLNFEICIRGPDFAASRSIAIATRQRRQTGPARPIARGFL
jgi:hypothetical protein